MREMSFSGMPYPDNCPPPPGIDSDFPYSRDLDQRERDRFRRHEYRSSDYRSDREDRYCYNDRDIDSRDYFLDDRDLYGLDRETYIHDRDYSRRSRYESRRSSGHSEELHGDRDERRAYRDRERFRDFERDRDRGRGDRGERDRVERDRVDRDRVERDRVDRDRVERDRVERDRVERDRVERDRLERDRVERERVERDRIERERLERDRVDRDRDRGRDRDHSRERERERTWDRDRDSRDRDRGREDWREEIPNNTIMVRNLGPTVTEADIRNEITRYSLQPKDIRLMRKKESSRAFAFVEFNLLSEAVRWKELTQGLVFFDGQCRSTLHYSIPKEAMGSDRNYAKSADWTCSKCGVNNFRRRDLCFKCNSPRDDSDLNVRGDGRDEVSSYPSNTLLFRNLDVLTTEERVLSMLGQLTMLPIKSLKVAKDSLTNTSRGFAFVELHSTSEATQLHDLLLSMGGNFFVDGRQVTVSYARRSLTAMNGSASANAASVALAAAQWTNQDANSSSTDPSYQQNASSHNNASATMPAQASIIGLDNVVIDGVTYRRYPVPDISSYRYDQTSGYYYDPSTGLYYDSNSQYYYNGETQQYLYWDGEKQTYLPAPTTASEADSAANANSQKSQANTVSAADLSAATIQAAPKPAVPAESAPKKEPEPSPKNAKQDKVKIAKKIAKEMEKWAKTLNQRKENAKLGISMQAAPHMDVMMASQAPSADAGFAVLEKKATAAERNALVTEVFMMSAEDRKFGVPAPVTEKPILVAAYGGESDSDPEIDTQDDVGSKAYDLLKAEELKLTDWSKMACLMCKRQFPNRETLLRHQQLSDLHKQNLDVLKLTKLTPQQVEDLERRERESGYRDRAKERRKKFGQPDDPPPNRLKSKYLKSREDVIQAEQPTKSGIGSDNIGNKMLKAMGWTEGQGLGKSGQGMSGIIEVQQRSKTAGLGMKGSTYGAAAGDSYKDAVKKAMQARFKEISDQ